MIASDSMASDSAGVRMVFLSRGDEDSEVSGSDDVIPFFFGRPPGDQCRVAARKHKAKLVKSHEKIQAINLFFDIDEQFC